MSGSAERARGARGLAASRRRRQRALLPNKAARTRCGRRAPPGRARTGAAGFWSHDDDALVERGRGRCESDERKAAQTRRSAGSAAAAAAADDATAQQRRQPQWLRRHWRRPGSRFLRGSQSCALVRYARVVCVRVAHVVSPYGRSAGVCLRDSCCPAMRTCRSANAVRIADVWSVHGICLRYYSRKTLDTLS